MGGESDRTARLRLSGKTCWNCKRMTDPPPEWDGDRLCLDCYIAKHPQLGIPAYRIRLTFSLIREGEDAGKWCLWFLRPDGAVLGERCRILRSAAGVRNLIARTPTQTSPSFYRDLEAGIRAHYGAVYLDVTADQHYALNPLNIGRRRG